MYKDVLLAVDLGDEGSWEHALPESLNIVGSSDGVLHIVTVIPDFGMAIVGSFFPSDFEEKALASATKKLHDFTSAKIPESVKVQHIVCHGRPADEIMKAAAEISCDIIVIGSHTPGTEPKFLGSVASSVVANAKCSVLVVRG